MGWLDVRQLPAYIPDFNLAEGSGRTSMVELAKRCKAIVATVAFAAGLAGAWV